MAVQWIFFLAAGQVPEFETEPVAITFHLTAELLTAVVLIAAGVGLLRQARHAKAVYLAALGMLSYTVINSAGYFTQNGDWLFVVMFGVLLVLTVASFLQVVRRTTM